MKAYYDFHIHSALSPCADNANTPVSIVAMAAVKGLNIIAVSDHNAIENVAAAMEAGEALQVTVVPSMELQTTEDIHLVTLFPTFGALKMFYDTITFQNILNEKSIFGDQLIVNSDDEVTGEMDRLLLASSDLSLYDAVKKVREAGGLSMLAHIDREANGVLAILGDVPDDLGVDAIEFSHSASELLKEIYKDRFLIFTDSDAHTLEDISDKRFFLEIPEPSIKELFHFIVKKRKK